MSELEVSIVKLAPMRVASCRAVSESPERDAWEQLRRWAGPRGLLADIQKHPVFGFNNPPPSPDSREYGYEFWICVGPDVKSEGEIEVKDFPGGLYAVTTCKTVESIGEVWKSLWEWVQASEYEWRKTHELEKPHDPLASEGELVFDLYVPIDSGSNPKT
jgi:DNA gyrase inhibitor GyrI